MRARRTLTVSVLSIAILLLLVGVATRASWSDLVASEGNVFTAGKLSARIMDTDELWTETHVHNTWGASNMYPGQVFAPSPLMVSQLPDDSAVASKVHIRTSINTTVPGMDRYIQVVMLQWQNGGYDNMLARIADLNGNGFIDLDDLENTPGLRVHAPAGPLPGGVGMMLAQFKFHESADNGTQGGSVTAKFEFTVEQ